jgi:nanoRNase/pAp phosphatase (c-di-AMP/oligoRNAs hydrolase)
MKNEELMLEIVERLKVQPGIILLHHNADIDAVGSAIALQSAFPGFSIGAFQKINQMSKKFLNQFDDVKILSDPELEQFKTIVILDTSSPSQLGVPLEQLKEPIVIDHHKSNEKWKNGLYYNDDSKTSCAEIIFELLQAIDFEIKPKFALAILVAILADTGHFKYANPQSLLNFGKLLEIGNYTMMDILDMVDSTDSIEFSQRIAHLKGAQRLRFRVLQGYLVVISQLSSFEASMCKHLLILGADIAFVGAQHDSEVRISGRASAELVKLGLHLGEFFQNLGTDLSCDGGGHAGAGGLNGIGDAEMVLNICLEKISDHLKRLKIP